MTKASNHRNRNQRWFFVFRVFSAIQWAALIFLGILVAPAPVTYGAEEGAKMVLRMNHQFPKTTVGSKIDQWFADEIFAATQGKIEIKIFWSNRLGDPRDNLALLRRGDIDMAAMSAGYYPSELPLFAAPNAIPMGMDDVCQASALMKLFLDEIPAMTREAREQGACPLFFHVLNPYLLVTKEPLTSVLQLAGKRIRTWGDDMPRLMRAVGAKPVNLFLSDVYAALEHDVIDACPFSVDLVVSYNIYRQAKHISEIAIWEGPGWGVWISEKVWRRLSEDDRRIFRSTAEKARLMELPASRAAEKNARAFLKSRGVEFHSFPLPEQAKIKAVSPDFFGEFIAGMQAMGKGDAARQMVNLWLDMREQVRCSETVE